jgi:oxygen-independent coproporphyrinogen-3 oxidase
MRVIMAHLREINSRRPCLCANEALFSGRDMPTLSELFAVNVPRYTSYPTAPHFHPGIGENTYREWLHALPGNSPLSLYLHIPFCDTLCWFCGCNTGVVNHYRPVAEYLDLLLKEIDLVAGAIPGRRAVSHIHWGGGSPTLLSSDGIGRLAERLRERFDILPDAEFAIEIDPRGLQRATVKALAQAGLTRASIGLQDCDATVQRAINRMQTNEETAGAVAMLRDEGVESINLDLIYGLPHQTLTSWRFTLDFALSLSPDRLAVFGYAHVPQFKKHQALIPLTTLPGLDSRMTMAKFAHSFLCERGYAAIGLDHFAKPADAMAKAAQTGKLARNFQGYTTDRAAILLGLGASSIGSLPQGYVQNLPTVPLYRAMVEAGRLPVARGIALSDEDKIRRTVIEDLMCRLEVDLKDVAENAGVPAAMFDGALERLSPLIEQGLVERHGLRVCVSREWTPVLRLAAAAFDEYLPGDKALHSLSV